MKETLEDLKTVVEAEEKRDIDEHGLFRSRMEALGTIYEEYTESEQAWFDVSDVFEEYTEACRQCDDRHMSEMSLRLHKVAMACAAEFAQLSAMANKAVHSLEEAE